jgi:ADP-ribose pyrophosphatase
MERPIVAGEIRKVYQGRIFTVQIETIVPRSGGQIEVEIVRHPGSVVIVPVTDAGEIVLVRQYRHAIERWAWELPGGSLNAGENVREAAERECHEEIGLIPSHLEPLGAFFPTPGYCDEEMHFFKATGLHRPGPTDEAAQDDDEDIEARVFTEDQLRSMIARRGIVDLKSMVGLTLVMKSVPSERADT